jgi:predicted alpha/beta hydrolase family esterase
MTEVFLIHGAYGNPEENWFPWLKKELEKLDCWVYAPKFPTPEKQSLENWRKVLERYEQHINGDTIFIGHSAGAAFILSVLETLRQPVKASFLVAGWVGSLGIPRFDSVNATLTGKEFRWHEIRRNCRQFHVYASDNDPYVPLVKTKEMADNLLTQVKLITHAGHFGISNGYRQFEVLLRDIRNILQEK